MLSYIGDGIVTPYLWKQFSSYLADQTVLLRTKDIGSAYYQHILGEHENRQDEGKGFAVQMPDLS